MSQSGLQQAGGHRRMWRQLAPALHDPSTGGGSSGSGGNSGGGSGDSDDHEEEGGGLARNIWVLVVAAAVALGLFKVGSNKLKLRKEGLEWLQGIDGQEWQQQGRDWMAAQKQRLLVPKEWLQSQSWPQAKDLGEQLQQRKQHLQAQLQSKLAAARGMQPASVEDVATVTRLTQEAFAELVRVRERLDTLEQEAGISSASSAPTDATLVSGSNSSGGARRRSSMHSSSRSGSTGQRRSRHRLAGVVRMGGGLMWAQEDTEAEAGAALREAGVKLGTDVLLQLSGLLRGGRDSVHAECRVDTAAQQLSLRKVLYSSRLGSHLRLILAPFGARGRDAAYTLNPLAGQGLTSMVRDGSPLHHHVLGSLVGLGLEVSRAWLNAGYFAQTSADGTAACSLMAQAVVAPLNSMSIGATFLEHRSEVAAAAGGTNGELADADNGNGGLQRPSMLGALERFAPLAAAAAAATGGASVEAERQLGATLAWKLGDTAVLHGWAAANGDEVEQCVRNGQMSEVRPHHWGLSLGSYPDGSGNGWAFGMGRSAATDDVSEEENSTNVGQLAPNLFEVNLQFNMGDGLQLIPGMVLLKHGGGRHTAFLGLKSAWTF